MTTNDAVGKKIVEALKKQSSPELNLEPEIEEVQEVQEIENVDDLQYIPELEEVTEEPVNIVEEKVATNDTFDIKEAGESTMQFSQEQQNLFPNNEQNLQSMWNFNPEQQVQPTMSAYSPNVTGAKQFDMPSNVAVLKKLITQLPSGVTKQTGAQIIKQTMEALGISMNTVLHEAQKVQDDMNDSIKNCMITIQEYKNNIKSLEKQGLDYQRQVNQLNDLISLFILSDKD